MVLSLTWYEVHGGFGRHGAFCRKQMGQSGGQRSDGLVPPTQMPAHARLTSAYGKSIMSLAAQAVLEIKQILPRVQFLCLVKRKSFVCLFVMTIKEMEKGGFCNINDVI